MRQIIVSLEGLAYLARTVRSIERNTVGDRLEQFDLTSGIAVTWVPDNLLGSKFSFEGLGIDYDEDLWAPFREGIRGFLERSSNHIVFTKTSPVQQDLAPEWFRQAPEGVKRFEVLCPDPASNRAAWEHYAAIQGPASDEKIEALLDEAFPFHQLYVFASLRSDFRWTDRWEPEQMGELLDGIEAIAVDAFDGSGVPRWER